MTYTLTLCLGMWMGLCNQIRTYDFPTLAECNQGRQGITAQAIGNGYAICAPKPQEKK